MLSSEVDWVIVEILSLAKPSRPAVVKICQGRGMSLWKWANLVSYVGFRKLDGSDLEGLVLAETKILLGVGLVMSCSRSQLRGVTNRVWV